MFFRGNKRRDTAVSHHGVATEVTNVSSAQVKQVSLKPAARKFSFARASRTVPVLVVSIS